MSLIEQQIEVVEVPLSQGKVAIIDADDLERVSQFKWTILVNNKRNKKTFYARRTIWSKEKQRNVMLHRFIMNAPPDKQIDHINGDGLDNRKCNLRLATNSKNHCNIAVTNTTTGFRGVSKDKNNFAARIKKNGQQIHISNFATAQEAALAYDEKAKEVHGEFATLNFPETKREEVPTYLPPYKANPRRTKIGNVFID